MLAAVDPLHLHISADCVQGVDQGVRVRDRHDGVTRTVHDEHRRNAGMHMRDRAGLRRELGQVSHRATDEPLLGGGWRQRHLTEGQADVGRSEPVDDRDHGRAPGRAVEGQQHRQVRAGRFPPHGDPGGIDAELVGAADEVLQGGDEVVLLRREC